jgi:glycosyltransferase involved in cell wall biosynthesis
MDRELVSIIIPALNAERFISKAMESVRSQTYTHWEIIAINDGGTDKTPQLAAEFRSRVPQNVQLLHHVQTQGLSAARNTGMKAARGGYIAFLDADDFWLPDHLESLCSIFESGKADLAYADGFVFRESPTSGIELLPIDTIEVTNPAVDLFRRNFINPSGVAITRKLMESVGGFDSTLCCVEDADYWIRSAIQGFQIVGTGKQTYYYRKSVGSLSSASANMAEGAAAVFEKHRRCGLLPEKEIVSKASDCYFSAGKLRWRQDSRVASRAFFKSWVLDKRRFKALLWFFLTSVLSLAKRSHGSSTRG